MVDKEVGLLQAQLADKKVTLELTPAARAWLAENGYDPTFGARPMARLVDQALKKPLAEALLFGALQDGGVAKFDVQPDGRGLALKTDSVAPATV